MDQAFRRKEVMRRIRLFSFAAIIFFSSSALCLSGAETMKELKQDLRQKKALASMERRITESLEDRKEYLQNGIDKGLIDADEEKKILRAIERIRTQFARLKEKEKLTPNDEKNLNRQLSRIYRLIWFCSRKEGIFIYHANGKKFFLKEPWQSKYQKSSLSDKEMEEILNTLNRFGRLNNFLKESGAIAEEERKNILQRGEKVLLEKYFTLQEIKLQEKKNSYGKITKKRKKTEK